LQNAALCQRYVGEALQHSELTVYRGSHIREVCSPCSGSLCPRTCSPTSHHAQPSSQSKPTSPTPCSLRPGQAPARKAPSPQAPPLTCPMRPRGGSLDSHFSKLSCSLLAGLRGVWICRSEQGRRAGAGRSPGRACQGAGRRPLSAPALHQAWWRRGAGSRSALGAEYGMCAMGAA
jgi:hypothetical protein